MAERRREAMKNQAYYDVEVGVVRGKLIGDALLEEAAEYFAHIVKLFEGKEHRYAIIDLSQASNILLDRKARNMITEEAVKADFEKVAYVGVNPIMRMIAKAVRTGAKMKGFTTEIGFFKTEQEALAWIKGEAQKSSPNQALTI